MKMGYGSKSWSTPWLGEVWFVAAATGASVWGDSTLRFSSVSGFVWKHDKYGIFKQTHHHPSSFSHYIKIAVLVAISQFFLTNPDLPRQFQTRRPEEKRMVPQLMFRCQAADVMAIRVGGLTPIFSSKDVKQKWHIDHSGYGDGSKPWYLVNPKIAGKWMFIPLKMVLIGIDPYPDQYLPMIPAEMVDSSEMPRSKSEVSRLLAFRWELGANKKRQRFQFGRHGNMDENGDTRTHIIYEYIESHVHTYNRNMFFFLKEPLDSLSSRRDQVALSKVARNFSLLRSETWQTGSNSLFDIHMPY